MSLELYTPDYSNRYEITHAISVQMSDYYNDKGKLILVLPVNDYNIEAVKNDSILYDTQKKLAYIIKNVKTDTPQNRITANGYTTNHFLDSRVIASPVAVTTVESGVYSVVNGNLRGLSKIAVAPSKGLTEATEMSLYGGTILQEIMPVLASVDLGHRMTWDHRNGEHVFEVYKGEDLTTGIHAVVFSDEQGTARDLVINDDVSTFKNVAYVVAEYEGNQLIEVVGDATGDARHEQFFSASLSKEDGETEEQFRAKMRSYGATELAKLVRRQSFSVVIDPSELGTVYNIGDLVSCVSKRFGVKFNARISGMKYKKDANGETTEVILGEPKLTIIGEVKLDASNAAAAPTGNSSAPVYEGEYTVTPMLYDQTLYTSGKLMTDDTQIKEIPIYVVSNTSGGSTVTIGGIEE